MQLGMILEICERNKIGISFSKLRKRRNSSYIKVINVIQTVPELMVHTLEVDKTEKRGIKLNKQKTPHKL